MDGGYVGTSRSIIATILFIKPYVMLQYTAVPVSYHACMRDLCLTRLRRWIQNATVLPFLKGAMPYVMQQRATRFHHPLRCTPRQTTTHGAAERLGRTRGSGPLVALIFGRTPRSFAQRRSQVPVARFSYFYETCSHYCNIQVRSMYRNV